MDRPRHAPSRGRSRGSAAPKTASVTEVARRYTFTGRHHVPGLPEPWCTPHRHVCTVEVIARVTGVQRLVVDTDALDRAWRATVPLPEVGELDLDRLYGAASTTVEALAARWLGTLRAQVPAVRRVVVWEDGDRWGACEIRA
jgi:hypothetical protein